MREFVKPKVVVSKCIEFEKCRFNGLGISSDVVENLKSHVDFQPVCPEVEIGLGVPRNPVRIVSVDDDLRLMQPGKDNDVTEKMQNFTNSFLSSLKEVDGFILKSRSPSCGIKEVKVYPSKEKSMPLGKVEGFFGGAVLQEFPYLAIESEGRLRNFGIREHFLTKIYTLSSFREVKASNAMKELVQFHSENKLLLMAYNQSELRILGRIVANPEKKAFNEVISEYEKHLCKALLEESKYTSNINVLMHAMGYFSKMLSSEEKAFFLGSLEKYRAAKIPLSVNINIIRSWIIRFGEPYLEQQTFFEPYPEELMEITDSGKGRDL